VKIHCDLDIVNALVVVEGLPFSAGVHRDAGSAGRDVGGFLENVVGEQLQHRRHADETARSRQSKMIDSSFVVGGRYSVQADVF